ncbi:RidA family protein [Rhabdothermincola sediminis]|uniref:RidA family protein n=1 Tax=Rhabdothermincola sediminis TaxID=2751370 RepID=UPI001AA0763F|nr:Rid family detoxifying hydrolase [Rhabdothermincola sediminis]
MTTPIGPYTSIVRAGDLLVVSGQVGVRDGAMVPGGVAAETRQAIDNIAALLATEGASLADVVKTTVFLRHMRDFALMNEAYAEIFGETRPARSTVAVVELPALALVEIEAWAYRPRS